jgi:FkbM family methyltransferase
VKLDAWRYHFHRLRHEIGQKLILGGLGYRVRGYLPNRLSTDFRHEQHLITPLTRALERRPGLFIDVGVNVGQTLLKVLSIAPHRSYLGFEPQIGCAYFVDQFLRDNQITTASVVPLALSDKNTMLPIFAKGQFDEMASLVRDERDVGVQYVSARVGDEVLAELGIDEVAIIKVDVEGAELQVFRGLEKTVAEYRPVCFFEVLPNYTGEARTPIDDVRATHNRSAAASLRDFFAKHNYFIHQIDGSGVEQPIEKFDLDSPADFIGSDYVAHPN